MTFAHIGNGFYTCLSTDTKVTTGITTNSFVIETNTGNVFYFSGGVWNQLSVGGGSGEINTGSNVGTGEGSVFRNKTSTTLNFKTLKAGTNVTLTNNADDVTINSSGGGTGEANTYSTVGTGAAWTLTKSGVNLPFRSFIVGSNKLTLSTNANDLTLDVNETNLTLANLAGSIGNVKISDLAYSKLTSVPATFPPSVHTHAYGDLTSIPTSFTPSSHASSHNSAGSDVVHIDTIGSGTDVTTNNATTLKHGLLPKLSGTATEFLTGTGTWAVPAGGGGTGDITGASNVGTGAGTVFRDETTGVLNFKTIKAGTGVVITNNTNDVTIDATGAGGGEANTYSSSGTGTAIILTKSGVDLPFKAIAAASNKITIANDAPNSNITIDVNQTNLSIDWGQLTSVPATFTPSAHTHAYGDLTSIPSSFTPSLHAVSHHSGGTDALTLGSIAGTIGNAKIDDLAYNKLTGVPTSFTPSTHAATHNNAGTDVIHLDTIGSGTDIITNNASTTKHGLLPKLSNVATQYLNGTGGWTTPPDTGEVNTYSNSSVGGIGIILTKSGANLPFKGIAAASNKISIANDATNFNVTVDVNQANLSIGYGQLTSVPTSFNPSTHAASHLSNGTDPIAVATTTVRGTVLLAADGGTTASTVIQATDTRLSNARAPTAHNHAAADINSGTLAVAQGGLNKSTITQHALLKGGATNSYTEIAPGTNDHVLAMVAGTPAWKSLDSERTGKATASGNGSSVTFTIAHGLGALPGYAFVDCSSHAIARTWTMDATNITVVFASAPPSGTANVIIFWRVIAT